MGGKLLAGTRRYKKEELLEAESFILCRLREAGYTCKSTTAYGNKESFGDLDIVVAYTGTDKLLPLITEVFKPTELFDDPNQNIISFNYHDLSVDLIFVSEQDFDFAHNYLSYNDLGNLIGKTAHAFGVHLGPDGLWYKLRDDKHILGKITITKNWYLALRILGFEPNTYAIGFPTKKSMFEFICNGKFFNIEQYVKVNAKARAAERKRETYREFLEYCEKTKPQNFIFHSVFKQNFLKYLLSDAKFKKQYDSLVHANNQKKKLKLRFSGTLVTEITGLTGQKLGRYLDHLKGFDLISMNASTIKKLIVKQLPIFEELYDGTASIKDNEEKATKPSIDSSDFRPSEGESCTGIVQTAPIESESGGCNSARNYQHPHRSKRKR